MAETSATVLIGYDGSEDSDQAIRCAARLLAPRRALVAHVWDSLAQFLLHTDIDTIGGTMAEAAEEFDEGDSERARDIATRGADLAADLGLDATAVSARGRPKAWPTLLELADEHDAAAIVVGSRGLGAVSSALLGSVSSGVVGHAHLPVLVAPPAYDADGEVGPALIGYDGSDHAAAAIDAAGRLLANRDVVVENVWFSYQAAAAAGVAGAPVAMVTRGAEEIDTGIREAAQKTAERGVRLASESGLHAVAATGCARANVWHALRDTARDSGASMIVVGSRGRSGIGAALLGSVSRALVHHAPAPVLVVKPPR